MSLLIGISGGSGSGKTSFINELCAQFDKNEICVVSQDDYYRNRREIATDDNGITNFDVPEAFYLDEFARDIRLLKSGREVTRQEYTFNNSEKDPRMLIFSPAPIIVIEGLFVFHERDIFDQLDMKLLINAKISDKIIRRIHRDRIERNYPLEDVLYRYQNHVLPAYEKYIYPYKDEVDLIVNNSKNYSMGLTIVAGYLKNYLSFLKI
ncbi:MAG: uridine kinase [Saprospiraceae bacterium]|nr:uridine kinase [Saprospiraceae bacterium]